MLKYEEHADFKELESYRKTDKPWVKVEGSSGVLNLKPEFNYICGEVTDITLVLETYNSTYTTGEYHFIFSCGEEVITTINWPDEIKFTTEEPPTFEAGTWELNISNNLCLIQHYYEQ